MKHNKIFIIIGMALSLFFVSCDNLTNNKEINVITPQYENYTAGFERKSCGKVKLDDLNNEERDFELENQEDYDVEYEKVIATSSYDESCTLGVNNEILYPGALVDTSNGSYKPIQVKRAPITISANLETSKANASLSTTISNPTLSNVRNGIREIVNNNLSDLSTLPLTLSYEIKEITNENEFNMNLGFGLQVKKFALQENFSYENLKKQTNLAVIIKQICYTVDMDSPQETNSRDLFEKNLSVSSINKSLEGTIPAYVSSVAYGRIAIITIQTNYSQQEITNALSASWGQQSEKPGTSNVKKLSTKLDTTLQTLSTDYDTNIQCYVYGGATSQNLQISTNATDTLTNIFSTFNGNGEGALPITYTMRHLNGELQKIQNYNEYVIKHVTYNPRKIMNWDYLDKLIKNGTLFTSNSLVLDFSTMIDYSNPKEANTNANRTITIPSNIKELTLIGPNKGSQGIEYDELSLALDYRTDPIIIHLNSISFKANTKNEGKGVCIYSNFDAEVIIDIIGRVKISAKDGAPAIKGKNIKITGSGNLEINGGNGNSSFTSDTEKFIGSAIYADNKLDINLIGSFILYAGNSSLTENNGEGAQGYPGIYSKDVSLCSTSESWIIGGKGSNGVNGIDGVQASKTLPTDGKNGGIGGFAIESNILNINCDFIILKGGKGGSGGTGGKGYQGTIEWDKSALNASNGATGGNGGNGNIAISNDTTLNLNNHFIIMYAGEGGIGGNGGAGGDGEIADNKNTWIVIDKNHKGNPGNGGNGGNGGDAGQKLESTELIKYLGAKGGSAGNGGAGGKKWQIKNWNGTAKSPNGSAKDGNSGQNGNNGTDSI